MSSKRKSHPMKILSDAQLYPSNKPLFPSSQLFPNFPIITPSFLPQASQNNEEADYISEVVSASDEVADSASACEMTNTKSNNDANVPSHREVMNPILKKLALKSQQNLKKSMEENASKQG